MLVQRLLDWGAQSSKPCIKILSDKEIKVATNNFDETRILGKGGQGIVYHGTLSDKTEVAIKKARVGERDQVAQFINEIVLLSQIDYPHVVNLLCCCLETEIPLLVYEYVSGGTLYDKLLGSCLPWEDRLRIAAEIAQTLLYLHSFSPTPIVHRDVKPSNVLLDDKLSAKVSDFGASRLLPADREDLRKTLVQGTYAYLDPEYMQTRTLSEKSDVYAYGVLLMELVTGEKGLCSNRPQEHLVTLLESALQADRLDEVLDTRVVNADNRREIYEAALLAIRCTSVKGQERPTMTEIVAQLQVLSPRDCDVGPIVENTSVDSGVAVAEIPT